MRAAEVLAVGDELRLEVPPALRARMREVAREYRKTPTPSEERFWQALRGRRMGGHKLRRQQPLGPFVVDFFCAAQRLIVEVDGPIHESQRHADRERQDLLERLGMRFVRLSAGLVDEDLPAALRAVKDALEARIEPPLRAVGEGVTEGRG